MVADLHPLQKKKRILSNAQKRAFEAMLKRQAEDRMGI
jgi:hypothetical protein